MNSSVMEILETATNLEGDYEWLQASELYRQALSLIDTGNNFGRGVFQEKLGYSLFRAGFQAENRAEFLKRLGEAIEAYEAARGYYQEHVNGGKSGWALRCGAIAKCLRHWITPDLYEKRRFLDEYLEEEREALEFFWESEEKLEYCITYGELLEAYLHRIEREYLWDSEPTHENFLRVKQIIEGGITWGERAVQTVSELQDPLLAAKIHITMGSCTACVGRIAEEPEEQDEIREKAVGYLRKASELSEKVEDDYLVGLSNFILGNASPESDAINYYEKALKNAIKTRDIYLLGCGYSNLAYVNTWVRIIPEEDPDRRIKSGEEVMALYDEAMRFLSIISFYGYGGGVLRPPGGYGEYYWMRAIWETDPDSKIELLDKSLESGNMALKIAQESGTQVGYVRHSLSKALTARSRLESDVNKKNALLETAIKLRERNITVVEKITPYDYWNLGIEYDYLAETKTELAQNELEPEVKKEILIEAIQDIEKSRKLLSIDLPRQEKLGRTHLYVRLNICEMRYSTLLIRLYELSDEPVYLRQAIEVSHMAIESAKKLDGVTRIAESYWKIASAHSSLEEHIEAAENFDRASKYFRMSAEKIPQLKQFYFDHASYMLAWAELEKARMRQIEKKYVEAMEHYKKAAELHESTERFNHLAPNYLAWSRLEEAEDLSRKDHSEEAKNLFQESIELFAKSKASIEIRLATTLDEEEKRLLDSLVRASDTRRDYCLGRISLEMGKILDRQGNHLRSAREYNTAKKMFQNAVNMMEHESDRKELQSIVFLCQAWEKMMLAEARTSPALYSDAAELFEQAREHALDQSASLLAQAHCSFCKALEAGAKFERTRDVETFSEAKRHIDAATSFYLRAGYRSSSNYATATNRLLDGYIYTYNAQTEIDPDKKARFYQLAERLLQDSAGLFLMAKHPEKSEVVRSILENIQSEKDIALSLAELMHAPAIMSTTSSFSIPTPTHERAVGLEQFENADIQTNFFARRTKMAVGEDAELELELVNAGKAPAQLIKVDGILIEGFELKSHPEICHVEDSYLNLKGRTLSPLKTQGLKIVLKPYTTGSFVFTPRVLYLDEAGKYKSHEPEPVSITVQELGITGWLRGRPR